MAQDIRDFSSLHVAQKMPVVESSRISTQQVPDSREALLTRVQPEDHNDVVVVVLIAGADCHECV